MMSAPVAKKGLNRRGTALSAALDDLIGGLKSWELWSTLGWHEIRQRYRRSVIGPFWLTLSMGMTIGGLGYLYAGLFGQSLEVYLPYVALGMIIFTMISSIATEGSSVFINSGRVILQIKSPLSVHIYQMLWKNTLIFCHNTVIYAVILTFIKVPVGWNSFLSLLGLTLIVTNGVWVGIILGGIGARFRDVPPIVTSVMQIAFFLTPVFWTPGSLPSRELFVHLNPFYYLIEIVRMPLLGQTPPMVMWYVLVSLNLVSAAVALLFYARFRARIAYWV